jgi:hypothetical protein
MRAYEYNNLRQPAPSPFTFDSRLQTASWMDSIIAQQKGWFDRKFWTQSPICIPCECRVWPGACLGPNWRSGIGCYYSPEGSLMPLLLSWALTKRSEESLLCMLSHFDGVEPERRQKWSCQSFIPRLVWLWLVVWRDDVKWPGTYQSWMVSAFISDKW